MWLRVYASVAMRPSDESLPEYEPSPVLIPRESRDVGRTIKAVLVMALVVLVTLFFVRWLGWWSVLLFGAVLVGGFIVLRRGYQTQ